KCSQLYWRRSYALPSLRCFSASCMILSTWKGFIRTSIELSRRTSRPAATSATLSYRICAKTPPIPSPGPNSIRSPCWSSGMSLFTLSHGVTRSLEICNITALLCVLSKIPKFQSCETSILDRLESVISFRTIFDLCWPQSRLRIRIRGSRITSIFS
ncbi:hypothetical protein PENTCL1PPCAC_18781, partial [Pristionchus entomophagus]